MTHRQFEQLWGKRDFSGAYQSLMQFLFDEDNLGGASEYNEKVANEVFFLEHWLEIAPELYGQISVTLKNTAIDHPARYTLFCAMRQALTYHPSSYFSQKSVINQIISNNLNTDIGLEDLIQICNEILEQNLNLNWWNKT